MRRVFLILCIAGVVPLVGRAQEVAPSQTRAALTKADSALALKSYWMARRRAAGVSMVAGGALLVVGGATTLATTNDGATVLRSGGILMAGAGAVLLSLSAVQRHSLRLSRLTVLVEGRKPVSPVLWQRALKHGRRTRSTVNELDR